ncbi:hypothetical protein EYS14_01320 [Alteromonadaceae bacterium M269]|nr:hypothetical protein EYS14_01320 [Alteromonadaceae bacterium M269]
MNKIEIKEALGSCLFNPEATPIYDVMAGGLIWSDEIPSREEYGQYLKAVYYTRKVIAYRASLTLGVERIELRGDWELLKSIIPNWPGFREERIFGDVQRLLKIHKYKERKVFKKLEDED